MVSFWPIWYSVFSTMLNYVTKNVKKKLIQQLFYDSLPES